eukprot:COSAG06_NODE_482_length_15147_cov_9.932815_5_plen_358_part_00
MSAQQQATGSAATDKAALLDFKAGGDAASRDWLLLSRNRLRSWGAESEPCGAVGWNTVGSESGGSGGWYGVMCDGVGGRVTVVSLGGYSYDSGIVGDVGALAPLGELRALRLRYNRGVVGDVGRLGSLAELRGLGLDRTSVHGEVGALAGLGHLGERWRAPDGNTYSSGLSLARSSVWGPVSSVRLVGGLGSGWGSGSDDFSACSGWYGASSCERRGMSSVANGSSVAGADECACCVGSVVERDAVSGGCVGAALRCVLCWLLLPPHGIALCWRCVSTAGAGAACCLALVLLLPVLRPVLLLLVLLVLVLLLLLPAAAACCICLLRLPAASACCVCLLVFPGASTGSVLLCPCHLIG